MSAPRTPSLTRRAVSSRTLKLNSSGGRKSGKRMSVSERMTALRPMPEMTEELVKGVMFNITIIRVSEMATIMKYCLNSVRLMKAMQDEVI